MMTPSALESSSDLSKMDEKGCGRKNEREKFSFKTTVTTLARLGSQSGMSQKKSIKSDSSSIFFSAGDPILRASVVVEKLGGRESVRFEDGPEPRYHLRSGKEAQEETSHRLHVLQSQTSQLLGISIFLL